VINIVAEVQSITLWIGVSGNEQMEEGGQTLCGVDT
jgi:hypothetical protein